MHKSFWRDTAKGRKINGERTEIIDGHKVIVFDPNGLLALMQTEGAELNAARAAKCAEAATALEKFGDMQQAVYYRALSSEYAQA